MNFAKTSLFKYRGTGHHTVVELEVPLVVPFDFLTRLLTIYSCMSVLYMQEKERGLELIAKQHAAWSTVVKARKGRSKQEQPMWYIIDFNCFVKQF